MQENHLTTLMITHNMRDAIAHGNRLIMMNVNPTVSAPPAHAPCWSTPRATPAIRWTAVPTRRTSRSVRRPPQAATRRCRPTPTKFTASYEVEDSARGTLTGNGQTGVSSVEIQADSGTSVNVTAVAAEGFVFYKW